MNCHQMQSPMTCQAFPGMGAVLAIGMLWSVMGGCVGDTAGTPVVLEEADVTSSRYEVIARTRVDARDILPPDLLKSDHHTVLDEVVPYGFTNRFFVTSPFGQFDAFGEDMLRIRVQEVHALAALETMEQSSVLAEGAATAALGTFEAVQSLFTHPIDTLTGVPKGVWRFVNRVDEMATGERGQFEESVGKELIGFSIVKRRLAYTLNVDAYSSNTVLQHKLNQVSWAGFTGGMGVRLLTIPISGVAGLVVRGTTFTAMMNELIRDKAPEDLRRINREKLQHIGADESLVEAFLRHPWYSPRHETILGHALAEMEGVKGRDRLIEAAMSATFEEEALFFQRLAEMMNGYHQHVAPLEEVTVIHQRLVMGIPRITRLRSFCRWNMHIGRSWSVTHRGRSHSGKPWIVRLHVSSCGSRISSLPEPDGSSRPAGLTSMSKRLSGYCRFLQMMMRRANLSKTIIAKLHLGNHRNPLFPREFSCS